MRGHAIVGEQGVQERAQNAPLWGASVEDQRGGDVVAYPHHLIINTWVKCMGMYLSIFKYFPSVFPNTFQYYTEIVFQSRSAINTLT